MNPPSNSFTLPISEGSLGIAITFLKLDSWSPGADFPPIISTKGINHIKGIYTKVYYIFRYMGAIPCGCIRYLLKLLILTNTRILDAG